MTPIEEKLAAAAKRRRERLREALNDPEMRKFWTAVYLISDRAYADRDADIAVLSLCSRIDGPQP